jgi:hypothetical protein
VVKLKCGKMLGKQSVIGRDVSSLLVRPGEIAARRKQLVHENRGGLMLLAVSNACKRAMAMGHVE